MSVMLDDAPVADWVTLDDLFRDPFPVFARLRAESPVAYVPAAGRYLVTSYDAVRTVDVDQETFSADEAGSLMRRSMGHSMLRKDDPDHHRERSIWQPVLKPAVVKRVWRGVFAADARRQIARYAEAGPGTDFMSGFAAPFVAEGLRRLIGFDNCDQADLQRWSQTLIDGAGNYPDDPDVWARAAVSSDEVDAAIDEMLVWRARYPDDSLLSLLAGPGRDGMSLDSIRANVKMTIGGGLNEPRDVLGVATSALLDRPQLRERVVADPALWGAVFDESVRWVSPIGMVPRQVARPVELAGVRVPVGAKLGICILSANRDETVFERPDEFDIDRGGRRHLAFGKGVHVCLGAWAARAQVADVGLPAVFRAFRGLRIDPDAAPVMGGWVFRGHLSLPLVWDDVELEES